jgi:hypothetical protein
MSMAGIRIQSRISCEAMENCGTVSGAIVDPAEERRYDGGHE